MKILIDTNIYLDFYRSNREGLNLFAELIKFDDRIILTDQIIKEFERNREKIIKAVQKNFEVESRLEEFSSSFLRDIPEFKELIEIQKTYQKKRDEINTLISEILKEPSKDEVASFFKELVDKCIKKNTVLHTDDDIISKALKRKLIGNPPTSSGFSIGDEINWEIILKNIREDIIIVGRDTTYTNNLTFLQKDFHKETGYFISNLTNTITEALKISGITLSKELEVAEKQMVESVKDAHYSEYWKKPAKDDVI